jgi:hypothetical protein
VATATADTPASDIGKTVYVIDVLADGSGPGQRPGCGRAGDPVLFWFPTLGALATQQPTFQPGESRLDLTADHPLPNRLTLLSVSTDGPLE